MAASERSWTAGHSGGWTRGSRAFQGGFCNSLFGIRERAKNGSMEAFKKGPGRRKTDPGLAQLRQELERSNEALKELAIENTLLRGKVNEV